MVGVGWVGVIGSPPFTPAQASSPSSLQLLFHTVPWGLTSALWESETRPKPRVHPDAASPGWPETLVPAPACPSAAQRLPVPDVESALRRGRGAVIGLGSSPLSLPRSWRMWFSRMFYSCQWALGVEVWMLWTFP